MKIYTKTGDAGTTGLFGGPRVSKDDARICAYGSVDELNAVLGTARSTGLSSRLDPMLATIQHQLFSIGAELATPDPEQHHLKWNNELHVSALEEWIDGMERELSPSSTAALGKNHLSTGGARNRSAWSRPSR
jgi:cob(I)alamin adenosyltransferase